MAHKQPARELGFSKKFLGLKPQKVVSCLVPTRQPAGVVMDNNYNNIN